MYSLTTPEAGKGVEVARYKFSRQFDFRTECCRRTAVLTRIDERELDTTPEAVRRFEVARYSLFCQLEFKTECIRRTVVLTRMAMDKRGLDSKAGGGLL